MFNLNYPQNSLQALPFHDLDDREFHILHGSCHLQIDNLKDLHLYNAHINVMPAGGEAGHRVGI